MAYYRCTQCGFKYVDNKTPPPNELLAKCKCGAFTSRTVRCEGIEEDGFAALESANKALGEMLWQAVTFIENNNTLPVEYKGWISELARLNILRPEPEAKGEEK